MATRSRFQTMPTGGHGNDVGPAAVTGTAAGNVRRFTPIKPPRDLQTVLAPLDDDQYGSQFGPRYVGTLKLPMSSEGHILSAPGLLTTILKRTAHPEGTSSFRLFRCFHLNSRSVLLVYLGERTGSLLGIISLSISDFSIGIAQCLCESYICLLNIIPRSLFGGSSIFEGTSINLTFQYQMRQK